MRSRIVFGPYTPDHAAHMTDGLVTCEGVYPIANGYAPVMGFTDIADALAGRFRGGAAFVASDGTARLIAGDGTDLYSIVSGVWTSVSGSHTVNGRWAFTQFGDDIICVNGSAPVNYDLTTNTAAGLTGSPPTADLCCTVRDFVILGRANGNNQLIANCGQGDATNWATNGAGEIPLYTGGKLMGLVGGEYGLLIQRFSVKRMSYTGDNDSPWQVDEISTNYGCKAEGSIATAGRLTFYYSDRGFVLCDGNDVKPIGAEKVDRTFAARYADSDLDNMWSAIDPVRTLVIWAMPNALWLYNWTLDRWSTASVPVSAIFNSFSEAVSIDDLDAIYGDLDSIPYSLDDPRFAGGSPRLTIVHFDGRFGVLGGDNIAATLATSFIEPADNMVARVSFVRPVTDATDGLTLTVDSRQRLGDAASSESFSYLHGSGDMPVRVAARSMKMTLTVAEGTSWSYAQELQLEFATGGRR